MEHGPDGLWFGLENLDGHAHSVPGPEAGHGQSRLRSLEVLDGLDRLEVQVLHRAGDAAGDRGVAEFAIGGPTEHGVIGLRVELGDGDDFAVGVGRARGADHITLDLENTLVEPFAALLEKRRTLAPHQPGFGFCRSAGVECRSAAGCAGLAHDQRGQDLAICGLGRDAGRGRLRSPVVGHRLHAKLLEEGRVGGLALDLFKVCQTEQGVSHLVAQDGVASALHQAPGAFHTAHGELALAGDDDQFADIVDLLHELGEDHLTLNLGLTGGRAGVVQEQASQDEQRGGQAQNQESLGIHGSVPLAVHAGCGEG